MATSTSTNKNTIAAGTAEHCLPSINLGRLISITLLTQTCSLYLSIPVSNSCTPNSSTYLETKYLSWMEKDEVLSSCWHMIFCSLAPVIANSKGKNGAIMVECTARNRLITPLQSLQSVCCLYPRNCKLHQILK
jgi:hypothetical protein